MTDKNVLKEQLQTGTIDMPSVTGAVKGTGAVAVDLSSIEDRPKKTIVSMSNEAETGKKVDEDADKGPFNIRDEPRKSQLPQEDLEKDVPVITGKKVLKRQMKTGRFNMPSVSGALKKGGEVRIVVASVHEPPKTSRGPSTAEKDDGGIKEENNDKVACNTSEEPDKSLLPQYDIQGKKKAMTAETVLKQQPQTTNVKKPPVSGAVKKKKVVRFDLSNIEERPNEAIVSISVEAETGQKMDGNAEKEASHTGYEPRKNHSPEDLEQEMRVITGKKVLTRQMKTGKVNMPLVPGGLKKSGEVRVVVASVHALPKQGKGPSTTEKEDGGIKEENNDKVACNTSEEPNKSLLPQDDIQGKKKAMTTETVLKQQPQTTNVKKPPVSGAVKKKKVVRFDLSNIEERPSDTIVSISDEAETGQKVDGNAEEEASHPTYEPRKSHSPEDLEQDVRVITGKKGLKRQMKTGEVNMPLVSGALKKSGEVRVVVASVHAPPKQNKEPSTIEKGGGGMKEGNDDNVACNIGKKREESLLPQDDLSQKEIWIKQKHVLKQQLENTNVDISAVSGALKKSGEGRTAVASVHEPPKKIRGSSTKEMAGGGMKERRNDKVTSNTGEEPETSLLHQDDFPRNMQVMTGENVVKLQLQTANVDKPPVSGALKKTKGVSFELPSIELHPKKTIGSRIKETEV